MNPGALLYHEARQSDEASKQICRNCELIDLEKTFDLELTILQRMEGVLITEINARYDYPPVNGCALCKLFYHTKISSGALTYELRAYSFLRHTPNIQWSNCPRDVRIRDMPQLLVTGPGGQIATKELRLHTIYQGSLFCTRSRSSDDTVFSPRIVNEYIDFSLVKRWWDYCELHHTALCGQEQKLTAGLRLIDCTQNPPTVISAFQPCLYAALSYVWGKPNAPNASAVVLSENRPSQFSLTVLDAITACRNLDVPFLWVDRHYIDQSSHEDTQNQVSQMDQIYRNASITLIAAFGTNADAGLPGVSSVIRTSQRCAKLGNLQVLSSMRDPQQNIRDSTWFKRGWTYQEARLSRRRVVFTADQVYFECNAMNCQEALAVDLDSIHGKRDKGKSLRFVRSGLFNWSGEEPFAPIDRHLKSRYANVERVFHFIEEFSAKSLTYETDSLRAFAGILGHLRISNPPIWHLWGVPMQEDSSFTEDYFRRGLLWRHSEAAITTGKVQRRLDFPSWSWAGWAGQVSYYPKRFVFRRPKQNNMPLKSMIWAEYGTRFRVEFDTILERRMDPSSLSYPHALHVTSVVIPQNALKVSVDQSTKESGRDITIFDHPIQLYFSEPGLYLQDGPSILKNKTLKLLVLGQFDYAPRILTGLLLHDLPGFTRRVGTWEVKLDGQDTTTLGELMFKVGDQWLYQYKDFN
jgi:hypothetical protein